MDNRFTTVPNGHYAGLWYDLPDGTKRYFTLDEVANQQRIYRKGSDSSADAIQQAIDTRNHQPVGIQFSANGKSPFARGTKSGICVICDKPFTDGHRDQVTCGSKVCMDERKKQLSRESKQRRKAKEQAA